MTPANRGLFPMLMALSLLAGCGHKGNLYLETEAIKQQTQSAKQPDTPEQRPATPEQKPVEGP
ncbi:MAG: lipoprotein [Magnetococcales bacterium]|nr:lipoprotein [Magnetococcales bacterium]